MKIHVPREIIHEQNLPHNLQISRETLRRANAAAKDTQIIQPSFSTPFSTTGSTNTAVLHHHLSGETNAHLTAQQRRTGSRTESVWKKPDHRHRGRRREKNQSSSRVEKKEKK